MGSITISTNQKADQPHSPPMTAISPIQVFHYHNDHLGIPNELTNQDGEVVWLADYEAYGNTTKVIWHEQAIE